MLFNVPIGKCLAGCFTVTIPGFFGWVRWWCDPFTLATVQPSAFNRRSTSFESTIRTRRWSSRYG